MPNNTRKNKNEIDIMELIYIIWNGRFKIFLAIIISLMFFASNQIFQKQQRKVFVATTDVESIDETEFRNFFVFQKISQSFIKNFDNNINIDTDIVRGDKFKPDLFEIKPDLFEISKKNLLEKYLDKLDRKIFFEKAIHKFELLDANNYKDQDAYNEAVIKLASSVKIKFKNFKDINNDSSIVEKKNQLIQIIFSYNNPEKWKNVLIYVDKLANIAIREDLISRFDKLILYSKKKREFEHQDLVIQIENALSDYERTTFDRITFLKEQSAIAKELGIKKNTIEVLTFETNKSTILSDVKTDSPFYLRGYEAINKEIELVESRLNDNKKAFINGLFSLEKKLRSIE